MSYNLLHCISDWIFKTIPTRNGSGGGGIRWLRVCMQLEGCGEPTCVYDRKRGGGQIIAILLHIY